MTQYISVVESTQFVTAAQANYYTGLLCKGQALFASSLGFPTPRERCYAFGPALFLLLLYLGLLPTQVAKTDGEGQDHKPGLESQLCVTLDNCPHLYSRDKNPHLKR